MHIDCGDFKVMIGRAVINPPVRIAAAAVTRIFKAVLRPNASLWHGNRIENMKKLIHL